MQHSMCYMTQTIFCLYTKYIYISHAIAFDRRKTFYVSSEMRECNYLKFL